MIHHPSHPGILRDAGRAFIGCLALLLFTVPAPGADVVINEFLAVNSGSLTNDLGATSDWIELYNTTPAPVDLTGWHLTDKADDLTRWSFPATTIGGHAFMVIYASGDDRTAPPAPLHTDFALSANGEYLALVRPGGATIEHQYTNDLFAASSWGFPPQSADISYGLLDAEPARERYFRTPTPGASNSVSFAGFVKDTKFSHDRGFYTQPIDVVITTATPDAEIRYSLDGREPTLVRGTLYTGAIPVRKTTILRAAAYKTGYEPSNVDTHTYIFLADVVNQPTNPPGFPSTWKSKTADYDMDPAVIGRYTYAELTNALLSLPSMSVVTDMDNLFDDATGIYDNPTQEGEAWERHASAEWIDPGGGAEFQLNCGLRIQGNAARNQPKKPFRLLFKTLHGPSKLDFPMFAGSGNAVESFDTIVLRANCQGVNYGAKTQITDENGRRTLLDMGTPQVHGTYVHLYLNGLYWGLYNPTERPQASFCVNYFGGEKEEWDANNGNTAIDGTYDAFNDMLAQVRGGPADNAAFQKIQGNNPDGTPNPAFPGYIDMSNYIDYMLSNFYIGTGDWAGNAAQGTRNYYCGRRRYDGTPGYEWFMWDAERSLQNANVTGVSYGPAEPYAWLRNNAEFQLLFADHAQRHMFNGGALTPEVSIPRYTNLVERVRAAILCEEARWDLTTVAISDDETSNRTSVYLPNRTAVALGHLRGANLFPSLDAPVFSQHGGGFTNGFRLALTASSDMVYTLDGSDPRQYGTGRAVGTAYGAPLNLYRTTQVKARARSGATWSAVQTATFVLDDPSTLRITEVMYHPREPEAGTVETNYSRADFEFIEFQNTGSETIGLAGIRLTAGIGFDFTEGDHSTVAPGEYIVLVKNMAAFTNRYPAWAGMTIAGEFRGRFHMPTASLSDSGEQVKLIDGLDRTILSFDYSDNWQPSTDGPGHSLVIRDPGGTEDLWDNWSAWRPSAAIDGSPGEADPGVAIEPRQVVINEVLTHQDQASGDWIELYNPTGSAVDIGGWYLSDNSNLLLKYPIPPGTPIGAWGYLVFTERDHFGTEALGESGFALSELGDSVCLSAVSNGTVTVVVDTHEFDAAEQSVSFGRYVKSDGIHVDFTALSAPTPGMSNAYPRVGPVVFSEIMYHPLSSNNFEFVELHNITGAAVPLYDPAHPSNTWKLTGAVDYTMPENIVLPAGGYLLVSEADSNAFTTAYGLMPAGVRVLGPYTGKMDNAGEILRLLKPGDPEPVTGEVPAIIAERVKYDGASPWPSLANGGGPSLERISPTDYSNDSANWTAGTSRGSPGRPPPKILIASPHSGAIFQSPFTTAVRASISWPLVSGAVERVDLRVDGQTVASGNAPPWELTLDSTIITNDGNHTLTMALVDAAGTNTSPGVVIAVSMIDRIELVAPSNGAAFLAPVSTPVEVLIQEEYVVGEISRVEFFANGGSLGLDADNQAPFEHSLAGLTSQGAYQLTARMEDDLAVSTAGPVTIHVFTNAPTTTPASSQSINMTVLNRADLDASVALNGWSANFVTTRWEKHSGSGTVTFDDPSDPATFAGFSAPGTYVLHLITTYGTDSETNAVTVTVLDATPPGTIPFRATFEEYQPGQSVIGFDGWQAAAPDAGVVVTNDLAGFAGECPVLGASHDLALEIDGTVSNVFEGTEPLSDVWFDMLIQARRWTAALPVIDDASLASVIFDGNGFPTVFHCVTPETTGINGWTTTGYGPVPTDQWTRVTLEVDFVPRANGRCHFRIWIDGQPVTQPMTWFAAASTNRHFASMVLGGACVDDVVVDDYDVLRYRKITASVSGQGTIEPAGEVLVPIYGSTSFVSTASADHYLALIETNGTPVAGSLSSPQTTMWSNVIDRGTILAVFAPAWNPVTWRMAVSAEGFPELSWLVAPLGEYYIQRSTNLVWGFETVYTNTAGNLFLDTGANGKGPYFYRMLSNDGRPMTE